MKTMAYAISIGCLFCAFEAQAESFQDALAAALQYHPSVEAAQATSMNAKDQEAEQKSALFPELNMSTSSGRIYGDNATSRGLSVTRGAGYSNLWEGSVGLSQRLFDGFETTNRIDAADARYHAATLDVIDIRENLALQLSGAYLDVMRTREAIDLITTHNDQIADYKERIMMMVDEGVADQAEGKNAEDIFILLDNMLTEYKAQHYGAQALYNQLTGNIPDADMAMPVWNKAIFPHDLDDAAARLERHPSLESARYQIEANKHDVGAEKASFYPDINGELSYLKKDVEDIIGGEVTDARAVIKLNWNFSTGGGQFARVRQRQSALFETQAKKRQLERQLQQALGQAWIEYDAANKIYANMQERGEINHDLFETNKAQFEGAQIRLLQLMQSENQYFQTRLELINSKYRRAQAEMGVLAALGVLQDAFVPYEESPLVVNDQTETVSLAESPAKLPDGND